MTNKVKYLSLAIITVSLSLTTGCVERRLTINTEPQGAIVTLNDEEIGVSPVTVDFNWYGTYKINLQKTGYETLNTHRKLKAPLHDKPVIDFFAENLWPGQIIDNYDWTFKIAPYAPKNRIALIKEAQQLRESSALEFHKAQKDYVEANQKN
jgi:hypothetical protein